MLVLVSSPLYHLPLSRPCLSGLNDCIHIICNNLIHLEIEKGSQILPYL